MTTSPIVIVDDDAAQLGLASAALEAEGFAVQCFSDATAALDYCARDAPALVVSDVVMPQVSGFEFQARYAKRFPGSTIWPGKHWDYSLYLKETDQEVPTHTQLDERASWFYFGDVIQKPTREQLEAAARHREPQPKQRELEPERSEGDRSE